MIKRFKKTKNRKIKHHMNIQQVDLKDRKEMEAWDEYVLRHPKGTPFHLSSWLHTIYQAYKFKPMLFIKKDQKDDIASLFPAFFINSYFNRKRIVSVPFSDYGGPLCSNEKKEKEFITQIIDLYGKKAKYIEIRCELNSGSCTICHDYYKRHVLELALDPDEIKKKINKKTIMYSIRKAKKNGVEIKEDNTINGVKEFYKLNEKTRTKHGVPSQPFNYFIKLYHNMIQNELAYVLLAYDNKKVIAASIFFKFKKTIHYKYNASDPKYIREKNPNHLLTWIAIKNACLDGYRYFDFGRTSPDNSGLMRYKEMWGAKTICCDYNYYPEIMGITAIKEQQIIYKMLTETWKRLPAFLARGISSRLYRHMA